MPSGYTYMFEKGNPSFEEFFWRCARAMGAFIHMRDDAADAPLRLPTEDDFGGASYYSERLAEAVENLKKYSTMSLDTANSLMNKSYDDMVKEAKASMKERTALRNKYESMLAQVNDWVPPTADHKNFKKFMVDQLKQSIEWDCDNKYYLEKIEAPRQTAKEWLNDMRVQARRDIEYYTKHLADEKARNKERLDWVQTLVKSVPIPANMLKK